VRRLWRCGQDLLGNRPGAKVLGPPLQVASRRVGGPGSYEQVVPVPEVELDNGRLAGYWEKRPMPVTKRVQSWDGKPSLTMSSYSHAGLWDGQPVPDGRRVGSLMAEMANQTKVLKYLEEYAGQHCFQADIASDLGLTQEQVRGAAYRLTNLADLPW
ncbi:MAG TPA: hypothetical protein VK988_21505, partial [Acidimicrobiales bacterium]|nr:hypothetical protein [Acidimicrobiales bacterium]